MNTKTASAITVSAGDYVWTPDAEGLVHELIINDDDATVSLIIEDPRVMFFYKVNMRDEDSVRLIDRDTFEQPHDWDCSCRFCYVRFC